jgi:hypothetical protein
VCLICTRNEELERFCRNWAIRFLGRCRNSACFRNPVKFDSRRLHQPSLACIGERARVGKPTFGVDRMRRFRPTLASSRRYRRRLSTIAAYCAPSRAQQLRYIVHRQKHRHRTRPAAPFVVRLATCMCRVFHVGHQGPHDATSKRAPVRERAVNCGRELRPRCAGDGAGAPFVGGARMWAGCRHRNAGGGHLARWSHLKASMRPERDRARCRDLCGSRYAVVGESCALQRDGRCGDRV